jgi:hypothetical protein
MFSVSREKEGERLAWEEQKRREDGMGKGEAGERGGVKKKTHSV